MQSLQEIIQRAFEEDCVEEDLTSQSCTSNIPIRAHIVLKQKGRIAGLNFLPFIFAKRDPTITTQLLAEEGKEYEAGTVLAEIRGLAPAILSAERTALNLLQHLSGVATLTARCVAKVAGTSCQILDTRKTLPGLRMLQKYAVRMGGGTNHRLHLGDRILIKNNHLALAPLASCIKNARKAFPEKWIQVEVPNKELFLEAISHPVNAILLDNMSPALIRECVLMNRTKIYLEASGGITLETIAAYAATGVDGISMGALTHSAPALDISLRVQQQ